MKNLVYGIMLPALLLLGTASSRGQLTPWSCTQFRGFLRSWSMYTSHCFGDFCAPCPHPLYPLLHTISVDFIAPGPHPLYFTQFRGLNRSWSTPSVLYAVSPDFYAPGPHPLYFTLFPRILKLLVHTRCTSTVLHTVSANF
jgi:hypothetical protein